MAYDLSTTPTAEIFNAFEVAHENYQGAQFNNILEESQGGTGVGTVTDLINKTGLTIERIPWGVNCRPVFYDTRREALVAAPYDSTYTFDSGYMVTNYNTGQRFVNIQGTARIYYPSSTANPDNNIIMFELPQNLYLKKPQISTTEYTSQYIIGKCGRVRGIDWHGVTPKPQVINEIYTSIEKDTAMLVNENDGFYKYFKLVYQTDNAAFKQPLSTIVIGSELTLDAYSITYMTEVY